MSIPKPPENQSAAVSRKTFVIAGILTTVYGLEELDPTASDVACLWLLHPRLQSQEFMSSLASSAINHWIDRSKMSTGDKRLGLIAASFDQRNHASRETDPRANQAWNASNSMHAQDMFSTYHGTAIDTSQLITYLSSYIFPENEHRLANHMVLGVSLGGHCAWHCILQDSRITTAVAIVGCPDYVSLMTDRARLSKLETWTATSPPGASFIGSKDFPLGLVAAVEEYDPAGLFLGDVSKRTDETYTKDPNPNERERLLSLMRATLQGKRILNLSGGKDKLVPYARGEAFLQWLKRAIAPQGWFHDGAVVLEDIIVEDAGHELHLEMVKEAVRFIGESLEQVSIGKQKSASRTSARL